MRPQTQATSLLMAGILFSSVYIFPALNIYLGNLDHFNIALFSAMKMGTAMFAISFLGALLLLRILTPQRAATVGVTMAGISLLCWAQGNLLVWDYGVLDGRTINWEDHESKLWIDAFIWLMLSVVIIFIARKNGTLIIRGAIFIFIVQSAAATIGVLKNSVALLDSSVSGASNSFEGVANFSKRENVLHIVADGFQSDVFEDLISNSLLKSRYDGSFDGFVFYRETLGIFPFTRFSVPAFLSGEIYSNQEKKNEYIDGILRGRTIISLARERGFEVDVVSDGDYLIGRYENLPYTNIFNIRDMAELDVPLADSALLLDLSLFRIAPGPLKKYIYNEQYWLFSRVMAREDFLRFKYFTHTYFMNRFSSAMRADRDSPVYKYLHIMNTHNPMVVDEDCSYSGRINGTNRMWLTFQSKCTLDTLSNLFERMKELGVYDDATIIIHGDHGGLIGNHRQGPELVFANGGIGPKLFKSLASPLLAIKSPNESGSISTSNVLASLLDIPDTLSDIMEWDTDFNHLSLLTMKDTDKRKRIFRLYEWQKNAWEAEYTGPITEFSIDGSHYEVEWHQERIFMPPNSQ
jgi:hypothetical protein